MHKPACNLRLQDPTPRTRRHSTQASVSAVVGMRSCYGVGFQHFLGLLPYCRYPPMWSQWELSHFSPSFLVVFSQKMPNISTGFSVSTLSYCQVEPLLLANVPIWLLSTCALLLHWFPSLSEGGSCFENTPERQNWQCVWWRLQCAQIVKPEGSFLKHRNHSSNGETFSDCCLFN